MRRASAVFVSRLPVLLGAFAVTLILGVGTQVRGSLAAAWRLFRIPSLHPLFADTRTITHSIDCVQAGGDPYVSRSFDPWHRLYNYPPIWLQLGHLGINSRSSNWIGFLLILLTIGAFLCLFRTRGWVSSGIAFLAVTCWPVLYCMERGNNDLVVFGFIVFGYFLLERVQEPWRWRGRAALIVFLTVLKIYPVAAVVGLLQARKGLFRTLCVAGLSALALFVTSGHRLFMVLANTPQIRWKMFGSFPVAVYLCWHVFPHVLGSAEGQDHLHRIASVVALAAGCLAATFGVWQRDRVTRYLPSLDEKYASSAIATACLAIYCFAFLSGANFEYRLIFLLGPLSLLLRRLSFGPSGQYLPAALVLAVYLESPYLGTDLISRLLDPVIFLGAVAWLSASLVMLTARMQTSDGDVAPRYRSA